MSLSQADCTNSPCTNKSETDSSSDSDLDDFNKKFFMDNVHIKYEQKMSSSDTISPIDLEHRVKLLESKQKMYIRNIIFYVEEHDLISLANDEADVLYIEIVNGTLQFVDAPKYDNQGLILQSDPYHKFKKNRKDYFENSKKETLPRHNMPKLSLSSNKPFILSKTDSPKNTPKRNSHRNTPKRTPRRESMTLPTSSSAPQSRRGSPKERTHNTDKTNNTNDISTPIIIQTSPSNNVIEICQTNTDTISELPIHKKLKLYINNTMCTVNYTVINKMYSVFELKNEGDVIKCRGIFDNEVNTDKLLKESYDIKVIQINYYKYEIIYPPNYNLFVSPLYVTPYGQPEMCGIGMVMNDMSQIIHKIYFDEL